MSWLISFEVIVQCRYIRSDMNDLNLGWNAEFGRCVRQLLAFVVLLPDATCCFKKQINGDNIPIVFLGALHV